MVPAASIGVTIFDGFRDFNKRKELGESNTEAFDRTLKSQLDQTVVSEFVGVEAGLQGAVAGAIAGLPGGEAGSGIGIVCGGLTTYIGSSMAYQSWAEKKDDSDIESE